MYTSAYVPNERKVQIVVSKKFSLSLMFHRRSPGIILRRLYIVESVQEKKDKE